MSNGTQIFEGMTLLSDRVRFWQVHESDHLHVRGVNFAVLAARLRCNNITFNFDCTSSTQLQDVGIVIKDFIGDNLDITYARTVVHVDEAKATLRCSSRTNPSCDRDQLTNLYVVVENGFYGDMLQAQPFRGGNAMINDLRR